MIPFKDLQDRVILPGNGGRFNENYRPLAKEWLNYVLGQIWQMEEWTFKQAVAPVKVTTGSSTVTNLPADIGVVHLMQNAVGTELDWRDWRDFQRRHYGETQTGSPYDYTVIGTGTGTQLLVGPLSAETSTAYQLLYERERCYYPSTTLTAGTTLPTGTLAVTDASTFPASGTVMAGGRVVTYTGNTGTTLTGCTGGSGTFNIGDLIVSLAAVAGELMNDSDVPGLPPETHQILIPAATAIGQTGENDYSMYLSDGRVQQGLDAMRRRYLLQQRDERVVWPSHNDGQSAGWW